MVIENIKWREILQKKGKKQFSVAKKDSHYIELVAKVEKKEDTYLAKTTISKLLPKGTFFIDELLRPYHLVGFSEERLFPHYDSEFLGNTCYAEAMGNGYDSRLDDLYEFYVRLLDGKSKKLFDALDELVQETISSSESIKQAALKAKYGNNQSELLNFPWYTLRIFEKLCTEKGFYIKREGTYSEYSLPDEFLKEPKKLNEKDLFKLTFSSYLQKNNYRQKIEESKKKLDEEYQLFVNETFKSLKALGFEEVNNLF